MDRSVSGTSNDGTPSRQLYDDPAVARRNILRLPSQRVGRESPTQAYVQRQSSQSIGRFRKFTRMFRKTGPKMQVTARAP